MVFGHAFEGRMTMELMVHASGEEHAKDLFLDDWAEFSNIPRDEIEVKKLVKLEGEI